MSITAKGAAWAKCQAQGLVGLLLLALSLPAWALTAEQQAYRDVRQLQRQGQWTQAQQGMDRLSDYVLHPYLQYNQFIGTLSQQKRDDIENFIAAYPQTNLSNSLQRRFLLELAKRKAWQEYLAFYPAKPSSTDLLCYHYYALWQTGETTQAIEGGRTLWLHGDSQPKACDALFSELKAQNQLDDALHWQRMLLAFSANKPRLMRYLSKGLKNAAYQSDAADLLQAYSDPDKVITALRAPLSQRQQQVAAQALRRQAKLNASKAVLQWQELIKLVDVGLIEWQQATQYLLSRVIRSKEPDVAAWADAQLRDYPSSSNLERRLRKAVLAQNWQDYLTWYDALSEALKGRERWQYWLARAYEEQKKPAESEQIFRQLASARSFYGFMSAQRLKLPNHMEEQRHPLREQVIEKLAQKDAIKRIEELLALGEYSTARSEWVSLVRNQEVDTALDLGRLAEQRGWFDFAVQASILSKQWDQLQMRFPLSFSSEFENYAKERGVESSLLWAVARQESALFRFAQSHAGARGLMQLMPATAKETAQKIEFNDYASSRQLYSADDNIRLGSAYLSELLSRYQGNRILATAAYNAGPHRVTLWLERNKNVPADVWIEAIPFRETRYYVQNVLAYQRIYQHRLNVDVMPILNETEVSYAY